MNGDTAQSVATLPAGRLVSVNVGGPRTLNWLGQQITTSIWKSPVQGRVAVRGVNLAGDDQSDRRVHGGTDKAVYSYAHEDAMWWAEDLGRPIEPGNFGENLTLEGIDASHAVVGEQWAIGSALFEVCQPRIPCYKLGARMGDPNFPPLFAAAGRPGAYLRILRAGDVGAGDEVRIVHRPAHGVTVGEVAYAYHEDHHYAARLLEAPELADGWKQWATKQLKYLSSR